MSHILVAFGLVRRHEVGGVGGCRFGLQPKDFGDHGGDLCFAGRAVASDRGFDLAGPHRQWPVRHAAFSPPVGCGLTLSHWHCPQRVAASAENEG